MSSSTTITNTTTTLKKIKYENKLLLALSLSLSFSFSILDTSTDIRGDYCSMNTIVNYRLECHSIVDPSQMRVRQHNTCTDLDCKRWCHKSIDLMKSPLKCHCYNSIGMDCMPTHRNTIALSPHLAHPSNTCNSLDCRLFDHNMFDMSPKKERPHNTYTDLDCKRWCHNSIDLK